MKTYPLLKSKLIIPSIPSKSLFTERIKKMDIADKRLVVLVAPAGFGKTTSILLSLEPKKEKVKWYRLEKEDNFLLLFYTHLLETLFSRDRKYIESNLHMLYSINNLEEEYSLINTQICHDMEEVCKGQKERIYLVFDDFQNVSEKDQIIETVRYFVKYMPSCLSIIVASRINPQIIENLPSGISVKKIDCEELLFTREETEILIKEKYNIKISKKNIDYLYSNSEGWIAALNIMCQEENIASIGLYKENKKELNVFSTYLNEFLKNIGEERKRLLMYLSTLDDFSVEELRSIFGVEEPLEFVKWLESGNIYIQKIMGDTIKYRFHSLFIVELQKLFNQVVPMSEQIDFYNKLGDYYRDKEISLSIKYYLLGNNKNKAFSISEAEGKKFFLSGKPEKMFALIKEFTEEEIEENPYLLLFKGMMLINTQRDKCHVYFLQAIKKFREAKEYSFLMNTFGMIMIVAFQSNNFNYLNDATNEIPVSSIMLSGGSAREKLIVSKFIALTGEDKLNSASILLKYLDRKKFKEGLWEYSYLMIRGILFYRLGLLEESYRNLKTLLSHPVGLSNDQWRIIGLVSCCNLPFLYRQMQLIEDFEKEFLEMGKKYKSDFSLGYRYYMRAFLKYLEGNVEEAIEALDKSDELYEKYGAKALVVEIELVSFLWNEETTSKETLSKAIENLDYFIKERAGHGLIDFANTVVGVIYKRLGNWDLAEKYLKKSLENSKKIKALQSMCGVEMQLADLYFQWGNEDKGMYHFKKWYDNSLKNGYEYFYELDINTLERLSNVDFELDEHKVFTTNMLKLYKNEKKKDFDNTVSEELRVNFFGDFQISGKDFVIKEEDFKTKKVGGILKYLLINRDNIPVSREKLASIFWPESDGKSSNTSLRVALYELRKLLSKYNLGSNDTNGIIEESKQGLLIKENIKISTDIEEFERKYKNWKKNDYKDDEEIELLKNLYDLYGGDFLEKAYYEDWVGVLQTHYSSMFSEIIHAYGKKLFESEDYIEAEKVFLRGLILDSIDEYSCKQLINIYKKTKQEERAKKLSREFKNNFKDVMGYDIEI